METDPIVNKVANSSLIVFDLEKYETKGDRVQIDLKDYLFEGLILREKDFREAINRADWSAYQDKFVSVVCTADAIIPVWAYMLIALALEPVARRVVFGDRAVLETALFLSALEGEIWQRYRDARVVVKGCSKIIVPDAVYAWVSERLRPHVASLMFGEPCSTVPLYKRPKMA